MSGLGAAMTVLAMGLGYSISYADPLILSSNLSAVHNGVHITSTGTTAFVASLATLTLAAAVLGAGALGDLYGKRRLFAVGLIDVMVFGVAAAISQNAAQLMIARAGVGIGFALVLGLSLATINDVFAPERRAAAIAMYFGVAYGVSAPQPAIGSLLADHVSWRAGFLVAPAVALIALVITMRFVPETPRAQRRLDLAGIGLVAVALLGLVFGISRLEKGFTALTSGSLIVGAVAAAGFVWRELHTTAPALDLRVFESRPFLGAVTVGMTKNFIAGGLSVLFSFYLVTVRFDSPALLGLLLVPATLLQAFAAVWSGRLATRWGDRTVLIGGQVMLFASLLVLTQVSETTPIPVLFVAIALNSLGGAVIQTPQSTIMMQTAPAGLGGAVAATKSGTGQSAYSLGPTLFSVIGTAMFLHNGLPKLRESGISEESARDALRVAHGGTVDGNGASAVLDPERARAVVEGATHSMIYAIHVLSWTMCAVPVAAIVATYVLVKPATEPAPASCRPG